MANVSAPIARTQTTGSRAHVALLAFFALAFGWTWGLWTVVALIGRSAPGLTVVLFLASAFGPSLAAFTTVLVFEGWTDFKRWLGRCLAWRSNWHWYALALFAPPLAMATALGFHLALDGALPVSPVQGAPVLLILGQFVTVTILGGPMGEEFGWRGYALPSLTTIMGWRMAALVTGVLWALWHLPLFWIEGTAQANLPMGLFMASTVALSVIFARLSVNTRFSVLPAILLHGSINWSSMVLPVMPVGGETRPYFITIALLAAIAIWVFAKPSARQSELENTS